MKKEIPTDKSGQNRLEPVLMLVPYFAPQTHAAMFRAHKLAKYLPQHGFQPIVVTTDTNYLYNEDLTLLEELPPAVEIHRARYIEPTLRGLGMALGGSDRSFNVLKAQSQSQTENTIHQSDSTYSRQPPSLRSVAGSVFAEFAGNWPDRHWTWNGPSYRLAKRLIEEKQIKLMYTSANPISFLRTALRLKRNTQLRWLADFRDPVGYGRKHSSHRAIPHLIERTILNKTMQSADHIATLSRSYGQIFFDLFGLTEDHCSFIPTGLDIEYLGESQNTNSEMQFVHVGEVMADQSHHFLRVLDHVSEFQGIGDSGIRITFIGRREVNEPIINGMIKQAELHRIHAVFIDHVEQTKLYEFIGSARACILAPGSIRYWWNNFAKMVDYIALGVPVIAHVPEISEARAELTKAGTAIFLVGDDPASDAKRVSDWLEEGRPSLSDYADRYLASRQVSDFAAVFQRLLSIQQGNKLS